MSLNMDAATYGAPPPVPEHPQFERPFDKDLRRLLRVLRAFALRIIAYFIVCSVVASVIHHHTSPLKARVFTLAAHLTTMVDLYTTALGLVVLFISLLALSVLIHPRPLLEWIRLKHYQFEVTFGMYMMSPREKGVFYSILFIVSSMVSIASVLYLPEHIITIANRIFYYLAGDDAQQITPARISSAAATASAKALDLASIAKSNAAAITQSAQAAADALKGRGAGYMQI